MRCAQTGEQCRAVNYNAGAQTLDSNGYAQFSSAATAARLHFTTSAEIAASHATLD